MLTLAQVQTIIGTIQAKLGENPEDQILAAKLDILYWIKNNDEFRTEQELNTKIKRIREELLGIYSNQNIKYLERSAKIDVLLNILEQN